MRELLNQFWNWAGITEGDFARCGVIPGSETFYFPGFNHLRNECIQMLRSGVSGMELDDCLTCLALDNEEEIILDDMKAFENPTLLERYVKAGVCHLQPEARWQIAELLRCCDVPGRLDHLNILLHDKSDYVVKRAENAVEDLKMTGIIV